MKIYDSQTAPNPRRVRIFLAEKGIDAPFADITALCAVDFGRVSRIRIQPEHTNLTRWHAAVSARPSATA
jgi:glutathione S-transferase